MWLHNYTTIILKHFWNKELNLSFLSCFNILVSNFYKCSLYLTQEFLKFSNPGFQICQTSLKCLKREFELLSKCDSSKVWISFFCSPSLFLRCEFFCRCGSWSLIVHLNSINRATTTFNANSNTTRLLLGMGMRLGLYTVKRNLNTLKGQLKPNKSSWCLWKLAYVGLFFE